eukprot:CAMPEP_0183457304 /NCGR_PEP_ID=MMETSP0370-20130417/131044_1 /TAXON_ID=268820 /ORGANISM="Peridinium aciculiferum, Strain PAER-2" /LENGTH=47 /DNA_ID= /DNA_START= /DNA_END= /DNA_ORIENTATION=
MSMRTTPIVIQLKKRSNQGPALPEGSPDSGPANGDTVPYDPLAGPAS